MFYHNSSDPEDVRYYDLNDFARTDQSLLLRKNAKHGRERSPEHNVEVVVTAHQIIANMGNELFMAVSSAEASAEYTLITRSRS